MNWTRFVLGGFATGTIMLISQIVLHTVVLIEPGTALVRDWATRGLDASAALEPSIPLTLALYGLGFVSLWVYVAMRPRFGPGATTALRVGVVVWAASHLFTAIYVHAGIVILPSRLVWLPAAWTLVEVPLATVVGAWLYRE